MIDDMDEYKIGSENAPIKAGRPKGSLNRVGKAAKEVVAEAAAGLGGGARLLSWAQEAPENEKAFWVTIYPKLLPLTVAGDPEAPLHVNHGLSESAQSVIDAITGR